MLVSLLCFLIGLLLIYLEFFLPGAILGVLGGVFVVFSVFLFSFLLHPTVWSLLSYITFVLFSVFVLIRFSLKKIKHKYVSDKHQEGFVASLHQKELYGEKAIVVSDLKPSGHIQINDENYQAVSKLGYIKKGSEVQVIGGEGARLIVKKWRL
jgi:membrane-bound serine protease (ClpP class)